LFNNVSTSASLKETRVGFTCDAMPAFPTFNRMAASFLLPTKLGVLSAGAYKFGDDLFSEQIFAVGYANQFGLASLGVKGQWLQVKAEGFGQKQVFTFSFGGIATLTPRLKIGAHIYNITQPKIYEKEKVPTILTLGFAVSTTDKITVYGEVEKNLDYNALIKGGVEYQIHKKVSVRTGVNIDPAAGFFGFGYQQRKMRFDYAYTYNVVLPSRHQVGIQYILKMQQQ
jgi:hypothetical protein